jgi:hypothetical protein
MLQRNLSGALLAPQNTEEDMPKRSILYHPSEYTKSYSLPVLGVPGKWQMWDRRDYRANLALEAELPALLTRDIKTDETTPGLVRLSDLHVGEVSRHFETWTSGEIRGWMRHNLGISGLAYSMPLGNGDQLTSFGGSIRGTSQVQLNLEARSGTDLLSDACLAVFDRPLSGGDLDTIRVVIPSENGCRSGVAGAMEDLGAAIGPESWRDLALRGLEPVMTSRLQSSGSYVADRLSAYARTAGVERPPMTVLAAQLKLNVYQGAAIRFGDGAWLELFPAALIVAIGNTVKEISARHGVPIGISADQLPRDYPARPTFRLQVPGGSEIAAASTAYEAIEPESDSHPASYMPPASAAPQMAAAAQVPAAPTHRVPPGGLPAWATPNASLPPVAMLPRYLELLVEQRLGDWALVRAENGWRGWVDARMLEVRPF